MTVNSVLPSATRSVGIIEYNSSDRACPDMTDQEISAFLPDLPPQLVDSQND